MFKLIFAILNLVVNHTQSVPSENSQLPKTAKKEVNDFEKAAAPDGIPQPLWDLRMTIPRDGPVTENVFTDLIEQGFDPNDVARFIMMIIPNENEETRRNENDEDSETRVTNSIRSKNILRVFGYDVAIPFTRVTIDSFFGRNDSFLYVFISLVVNFGVCFVSSMLMQHQSRIARILLCFIYGPVLYSSIAPPEVDSYSTTRGDPYTGITRGIAIFFIDGVLLLFAENVNIFTVFSELDLPIPDDLFVYWLEIFLKLLLYTFPFSSLLFSGHPVTTFIWILEFLCRYLYGHSGASGLGNSVVLALKSTILSYLSYTILKSDYSAYSLASTIAFIEIVLLIPMTTECICKKRTMKTIVGFILMGLIAYMSSYAGAVNTYKSGTEMIFFVIVFVFIVNIVYPYVSSFSSYFIFTMRINPKVSKTVSTLKFLTPCMACPLFLGICFTRNPQTPMLTVVIMVSCISKALTEPTIFGLAVIIQKLFFEYEMLFPNMATGIFYSLILVRKLFSIFPTVEFWSRSRLSIIYNKLDMFLERDSVWMILRDYVIDLAAIAFPFSDKMISTISLVWSVITGAPFYMPTYFPLILFPSAPRPNSFWSQNYSSSSIDIARSYLKHRTEHPIETPVYTSMSHSLVLSLCSLVSSGKLGIVTSNDFFLFISEPLAAFVHIISLEPNIVRFQLRGLEYNDETICHLGELAKLKDDISSYKDCVPNFQSSMNYMTTDWKTCATNVKLRQYNITKFLAETLFVGLDKDRAVLWTYISLAYNVSVKITKGQSQPETEHEGELDDQFKFALDVFDVNYDEQQKRTLKYLSDQYFSILYDEDRCLDLDHFYEIFHGSEEKVFQNAANSLLLFLSLLSADQGPETDDKESVKRFIRETEENYFVAPIQSTEFNEEFEKEEKDLVTFEDTSDGRSVLFFRQMEVVWDVMSVQHEFIRSFWATEAMEQIFFGEDNAERNSIQEDDHTMRNLIVQACDLPIGYPALISPVLTSFSPPPNYEMF